MSACLGQGFDVRDQKAADEKKIKKIFLPLQNKKWKKEGLKNNNLMRTQKIQRKKKHG